MVTAVLDEDPADLPAPEDRASEVDPGDVGLQRFRIVGRNPVFALEADAAALEEGEVRLVADQREDGVRGDSPFPLRRGDADEIGADLPDRRSKERADRPGRDPVLEIR